jgi:hypothetical protein
MWLAGLDLLLGARSRSFAAAILLGCSGCGDQGEISAPQDEAGYEGDADAAEQPGDARLGDHLGPDAIAHPTDEGKPDVFSGDEELADVSADAPKLALCLRLVDPQDPNHVFKLSQTVGDAYVLLVAGDCRVDRATYLSSATAFADWRNALYAYNLALWGCNPNAPAGFALLSTELQGLSSADAALVIELYLRAATTVLGLTTSEASDLRRDLQRLAGPLVRNESADYALSDCIPDAGAEIDVRAPADASRDAQNEAGPADADASSVDADGAARDSGVDERNAEVGGADVDQVEASKDATGEPAADTTEQADTEQTDAEDEAMDGSAAAEGGDD